MDDAGQGISAAAISSIRHGRRLGRYILCYELASGGMATVYLARTAGVTGFEKFVAIKIIHPHLAKEKDFVDMFLDEARIAARINHPNVCTVFEFGKQEGTYFLVMEYLVGQTFSRFSRALSARAELYEHHDVLRLVGYAMQQVCEGLHAAHELKGDDGESLDVVHRDVTPQNLFIGYDGSVRVVDFGVVSAAGRLHKTTTGALKGKLAYMSPEQIQQEPFDRRTDVWALGVSLWELLTRRLFRGKGEYETLSAVLQEEIVPPSEIRSDLPPIFDAITLRALERDPDKRYGTARDMGRDLAQAVGQLGGASTADLGDLMEDLFAAERIEQSKLLERARALEQEESATSAVDAVSTSSTVRSISESMSGPTRAARAVVAPRMRPSSWIIVLAGVSLVAGVVFGMMMLGTGSEQETRVVSASSVQSGHSAASASLPRDEERADAGASETIGALQQDPTQPPALGDAGAGRVVPRRSRTARRRRAPPRVERTDAPSETRSGTVSVVTPPGWADLFEGRRSIGRSPTEVRLPAGPHRIRFMPYGEGPAIVRRVVVVEGRNVRLVVRLP